MRSATTARESNRRNLCTNDRKTKENEHCYTGGQRAEFAGVPRRYRRHSRGKRYWSWLSDEARCALQQQLVNRTGETCAQMTAKRRKMSTATQAAKGPSSQAYRGVIVDIAGANAIGLGCRMRPD